MGWFGDDSALKNELYDLKKAYEAMEEENRRLQSSPRMRSVER